MRLGFIFNLPKRLIYIHTHNKKKTYTIREDGDGCGECNGKSEVVESLPLLCFIHIIWYRIGWDGNEFVCT